MLHTFRRRSAPFPPFASFHCANVCAALEMCVLHPPERGCGGWCVEFLKGVAGGLGVEGSAVIINVAKIRRLTFLSAWLQLGLPQMV